MLNPTQMAPNSERVYGIFVNLKQSLNISLLGNSKKGTDNYWPTHKWRLNELETTQTRLYSDPQNNSFGDLLGIDFMKQTPLHSASVFVNK